ncbi:MAG: hypothetical protein U0231_03580 [Nitrospiraceae bacterium]
MTRGLSIFGRKHVLSPLGAALTAGSASPIGLSAIPYNLTLVTLGNLSAERCW